MENMKHTMELIKKLVSIPSPTGNTYEVIAYTESLLKDWGVSSYRNRKGGLLSQFPAVMTRNTDC